MKTKMSKKILSVFLTLLMICSVVPLGAIPASAATISLNRPLDKAYTITAREYYSSGSYHGAIDYGVPRLTPVYAAENGTVTVNDGGYGEGYSGCNDGNGWGNYVDIVHSNGYKTRYAHMTKGRFVVKTGDKVERGQLIGYSGNSGNSTGPHLHFGLYLNGSKVYPESYIKTATGYHEGSKPCTCSTSYAGNYICTTSSAPLTIRSGHGTSYSAIGSIPSGATVYVSKANGTWAHVTYNGVSGYASMEYLKKAESRNTIIHTWVSNSEYGSVPNGFIVQNKYWLCYELKDSNTGDLYNTYSNSSYSVKLTIYNPDGSIAFSGTASNSDKNRIGHTVQNVGTYRGVIEVSGDISGKSEVSFTVTSNGKVAFNKSSIDLNLSTHTSDSLEVSLTGSWPDGAVFDEFYDSTIISLSRTGSLYNIQAKKAGTTDVVIRVYDKNGTVIASDICKIVVTESTYTISYNANGGTGAPSSQTQKVGYDTQISIKEPQRTGYEFIGWASAPDGSGYSFSPGSRYILNKTMTLYAVWEPITTYNIIYDVNGGTGGPADQTKLHGEPIRLSSITPKKNGYSFLAWYGNNGQYFYEDSWYSYNADITLKAVWQPNTYNVKYNANGGTGTMANSTYTYDVAKALSANAFTRNGYKFLGWSTSATATLPTYTDKQSVKNLTATSGGNVTLYAVWEKIPVTVTGITIQNMPTKTVYELNETFSSSGLSIKVNYSDGTSKVVTSGFTVSKPDMTTLGTKSVTVTYEGETTSFTVTLKEKEVDPNASIVRVESAKAICGQKITIPVKIENTELGTFTADIYYDSAKLKFVSVDGIPFDMFETNTSTPGKVRIVGIDSQTVTGVIANLTFEIIAETACTTNVSVTVEEAYDGNDVPVELTAVNGTIDISKTLPGDVNGDGRVSAIDARWVLQSTAGNKTLTAVQKAAADMNGDSRITAIDARTILKMTAGN